MYTVTINLKGKVSQILCKSVADLCLQNADWDLPCFQIINRIPIIRKPRLYFIRTLWWWGCGKSTGEDNNNEDLGGKINKRKGKSEKIVLKTG